MSDKKHADVLEKIPTGIEGFDDITAGGLPRGRTTLIMGGAGCGKTVFALQTLVNGAARHDAPGIFLAFEENVDGVLANAKSFGWNIGALRKKHLYFLNAHLSPNVVKAGEFDLSGLLVAIEAKALWPSCWGAAGNGAAVPALHRSVAGRRVSDRVVDCHV